MSDAIMELSGLMLEIRQEIEIAAPMETVFDAVLQQISSGNAQPDGTPMPAVIEPWPGGRWYRDLGNNTGHFWGHVQVIKPPKLLELCGPFFMSYPAMNHIQYRLTELGDGTRLALHHRAMGQIDPQHRKGVVAGWDHIMQSIKKRSLS
jgi:uncharacterized protein YndB with AHSA1/START domain